MRLFYGPCLGLLLVAPGAFAAPPTVQAPERVFGESGDWVFFTVQTDGKGIKVVPLDTGLTRFPSEKLKDPNEIGVRATKAGQYRVLIYTGNAEGPSEPKTVIVVFGGAPNPGPAPGPDPGPGPGPGPAPTPAPDAALVAAFRVALDADIRAGQGTKAKATDLAVVFDSGASLLDLGDPAIAPKTVGDLYSKMVLASVAKGIPRLPYLKETRAVIDKNTPLLNGLTELTPAIKADFQTKYRAVAAALTEASK